MLLYVVVDLWHCMHGLRERLRLNVHVSTGTCASSGVLSCGLVLQIQSLLPGAALTMRAFGERYCMGFSRFSQYEGAHGLRRTPSQPAD